MSSQKYYRKSMSKRLSPARRDYFYKKWRSKVNRKFSFAKKMRGFG